MLYSKLKFPKVKARPFFYTNFVSTIDGVVQVKKSGYWPIGSKVDYEVLIELRMQADCLIHGGNLAREFGAVTYKNISKTTFKQQRRVIGKSPTLPYYIVTRNLKSLPDVKAKFFSGELVNLVKELHYKGYKNVLIEGGPTLLGSFLKEGLLDEIFLTIAPKIYGNDKENTLNLIEGFLLTEKNIKKLKLKSVKKIDSELFLRYEVLK